MFTALKSTLEGCNVLPESGDFYYISETPYTSANLLINYYLTDSFTDRNVCFIALQNSWTHYCVIGNKLGISLRNKVADGTIALFDGHKELVKTVFSEVTEKEDSIFGNIVDAQDCLKKLYNFIRLQVETFEQKKKSYVVIIDSVMPLLNIFFSAGAVDTFIQYCSILIKSSGFLVLSSSIDKNDKESQLLSHMLLRRCTVHLAVKGLSTGISNDIHGELSIVHFPKVSCDSVIKRKTFHFKIEDRDIKIFERGLSSHVL